MKNTFVLAAFLVLLSGRALADERIPDAVGVQVDTNRQVTHTLQLAPTVGELYDAGTSLRNVHNYSAYGLLAAVGGLAVVAFANSVFDNPRQSGGYYVLLAGAAGLEITSLVCSILTWIKTGEAGDHLHRSALNWARTSAAGDTTKPCEFGGKN